VKALFHVPSFVDYQDCSAEGYSKLANDIPQSQAGDVAYLLDHIRVLLYNGQNDIIINTPGSLSWVYNLNWSGQKEFNN
jgi:carboxypeptidase C (cathepsin A)